ncbi:MAG: acyl carrier protein [Candidatus Caccosoma sp.]|nr:acyl carrier protein [Candidatus Caccosoma sp.]
MNDTIIKLIKNKVLFDEKVNLNTKLTDLSLDSLSFIELLLEIEEMYKIEFNDSSLYIDNYKTVNDLINKIKELKNESI